MATDIDELQIQIKSSAKGANSSVTSLIKRLEKLSSVIDGIDAKKVNNLGIGLNNVGRGSSAASAGLNKTSASAKKAATSFNGLASAFGKFYATYFLFIRGAKGIWKNIESSMDYVETSNYFSVALGQIGQQFEKAGYETAELYTEALSSELNKLNEKLTGYSVGSKGEALFGGDVGLGMDIEQMMNFQAKTLAVTNSVGLMGDASLQTAKAVSMLTGDISSLTNTDLETVMTNLSSGLIGQSRALYKYGIDITQNTLQQYALAEGIEKSVSEMTQAEKMQLRLLAILDQSKVAQTDLANTINSVANQYRVADQQIGNLGRTIGNLFLPIVKNVLPYVNGLIIALNNLFTTLGFELYGDTWLEDLQSGISGGVQDGFEDIEDSADDATTALNEFKKGVRGFDELNVLTGGTSVGSGILGELEGQIDLTESITKAVADYENSWNEAFATAENKASEFAETLTKMFKETGAVENFAKIVESIKEFSSVVSPFTKGFGDGFLGFFGTLAETSLDAFTTSLDGLADVIEDVPPETLKKFGEGFGVLVGAVTTFTALTAVEKKFSALASGFSTLGIALKAHPALATFTIGAGLVYFIDKYILPDAEFTESKTAKTIADSITEISKALEQAETSFSEENALADNIGIIYEKWNELNSKVGELTEGEKALLKVYADQLKEYCTEVIPYIDNDGVAFEGVADKIQKAIDKTKLYYRALAHEEYLGDLTSSQIRIEYEIEDIQGEMDKLYDSIREFAPKLSNEAIDIMLVSLDSLDLGLSNFMGKVTDGFLERGEASPTGYAELLGIDVKDLDVFLQKIQQLQDLQSLKVVEKDVEEELQKVNKRIEEVTLSYVEYKTKLEEATKTSEELGIVIEDTGGILGNIGTSMIPNAIKKIKEMEDEMGNASVSAKDLSDEIENLSKKKINIPVSIGGGSSSDVSLIKLISPNVSLKAYASGGIVSSGEVFVARENRMPEMVGRFGNQTAVANNDQIVSGIQAGVYAAMVSALSTMNTGGGETVIMIDGREVFRAVKSAESENYRKTGNSVFVH